MRKVIRMKLKIPVYCLCNSCTKYYLNKRFDIDGSVLILFYVFLLFYRNILTDFTL